MENIEVKICTRCKEEKLIDEFSKEKSCKGGRNTICKICCRIYNKLKREKNIEQYRKKDRILYQQNKEKHQQNYQQNKKEINDYSIKYLKEHPEKRKQYRDKWNENNKKYYRDYYHNKIKNNPEKRLKNILRNRLREVLNKQNVNKNNSVMKYLGCVLEEYKKIS